MELELFNIELHKDVSVSSETSGFRNSGVEVKAPKSNEVQVVPVRIVRFRCHTNAKNNPKLAERQDDPRFFELFELLHSRLLVKPEGVNPFFGVIPSEPKSKNFLDEATDIVSAGNLDKEWVKRVDPSNGLQY